MNFTLSVFRANMEKIPFPQDWKKNPTNRHSSPFIVLSKVMALEKEQNAIPTEILTIHSLNLTKLILVTILQLNPIHTA